MIDQNQIQALSQALESGKLPLNDQKFARTLIEAHGQGRLTFKMAQWVPRMVERANGKSVEIPNVQGVVKLLVKAKDSGLKYPKLWLQFADATPLRITVAGDKSKTPGWLMLTDGGGFGAGKYFGKIAPSGELNLGGDGYPVQGELVAILNRLAHEPAKVAAEFGHLTGHCCFCALQLTDERSVRVGYGPICAEKFGLAWGEAVTPRDAKGRIKAKARRSN